MDAIQDAKNAARAAEFSSLRRSMQEALGRGDLYTAHLIRARFAEISGDHVVEIGDLFEIDGIEVEVHYFDQDEIVTCGLLDGRAYVFTQSELLSARSMKGSN